ncbi:hypothetical protein BFJ63_vAg16658 [Fusarium oxysporum f. sp. narcissi]|uniref:Uncharacterized protein n=1 Tax=Fusarium oxysporum f. sp. narcissi TaxID=451672 RepID=A0A4Q2V6Y8_FUSOX|nr:hypothetical protein BFJ63_vAg16658 [Fusarium oxysporum f. sp. narcissi]
MPSIHDSLAQPNPRLDSSSVSWGHNTYSQDWIPVSDWAPWTDFTLQNLTSMYAQVLNARWRDPPSIDIASSFDRQIRDEQSMDYFLAKYVWPSVNGALAQATSILEWGQELFYLGPGSWCQGSGPPDWGLVSNLKGVSGGKFWNLLPGDTKLSVKWYPAMSLSGNESERYQWTLPLSQVSTYAAQSGCRYGFLITDQALVVLRFTKERIGEGLAATRPSRTVVPQTHQRIASNETDVSSLLESMSLDSFGAQAYNDHDLAGAANVEFLPPEYAVIPMSAHGKDTLTVKFSIFCLCLMAAGGCGNVDYGYPPLDSWRRMDRRGFIHNTSNLRAKKLPNNAVLCETQEYEPEDVRPEGSSDVEASQSGQVAPDEVQDERVHVSARYYEEDKVEFKNEYGKVITTMSSSWVPVVDGHVFKSKDYGKTYFTKKIKAAKK